MTDEQVTTALNDSQWELQQRNCEEHSAALREFRNARVIAKIYPGPAANVRLLVATVALKRAEGRMT